MRILLITIAILLTAVTAGAERPEPEIRGEFDGDPMYTLLPPDGSPATRAWSTPARSPTRT